VSDVGQEVEAADRDSLTSVGAGTRVRGGVMGVGAIRGAAP
jgi:hypothetical protein